MPGVSDSVTGSHQAGESGDQHDRGCATVAGMSGRRLYQLPPELDHLKGKERLNAIGRARTDRHRQRTMENVSRFLAEVTESGSDYVQPAGGLLEPYRSWLTANGMHVGSVGHEQTILGQSLVGLGWEKRVTRHGKVYVGFRLRTET